VHLKSVRGVCLDLDRGRKAFDTAFSVIAALTVFGSTVISFNFASTADETSSWKRAAEILGEELYFSQFGVAPKHSSGQSYCTRARRQRALLQ
jgi:hypothetical protein